MAHYNQTQKNPPPWVRNNIQQQPLLTQQMTVQSVALSQPQLTTTHLAAQNQIGQVQITPAIQSHQVQIPINQLLLNQHQLTPTFGQVQINQAQLANIATSQATTHQTYFTPSISLQQNVGIPQGTIQIQPSSLVLPSTMSTSIAPPGLAMPTTLSSVQQNTATYALNRMSAAPQLSSQQQQQQQQPTVKQRVFSGLVTKLHENFGFIDEDVIFQASVVKGNLSPQVGDRVLVEASYNGSMPFKWNATRVQVIAPSSSSTTTTPSSQQQQQKSSISSSSLHSNDVTVKQTNRDWSIRGRSNVSASQDYSRENANGADRSTPKSRGDSRTTSTRERIRSRSPSKSPGRHRRSRSPISSSPSRHSYRRGRVTPRYSIQIPRVSLDCRQMNIVELRRRYTHMYIPSDFVSADNEWLDSLPHHRPMPIDKPVHYHIFDKDVDPPLIPPSSSSGKMNPNDGNADYEPSDADYAYSAKVMLPCLLPMDELMSRCCPVDDQEQDFVHPARLIRFLVGHRGGKNETMAIGGPWSRSLDGNDPQSDPQVLIRTAIRTCRALTGIDLTPCTQWWRVVEIHYHRVSSSSSSSTLKNRIENVVILVPDVWSCMPTASQWESIVQSYIIQQPESTNPSTSSNDADQEAKVVGEEQLEQMDEELNELSDSLKEATHHSKLEPKTLKFDELKKELEARNLSSRGMRTQLMARLTIALRSEAEQEKKRQKDAESSSVIDKDPEEMERDPTGCLDQSDQDERRRLDFVATPQILVHPSRTAKGGKFSCSLVSLSVLLDYRPEDTKEHTFEVSLFSELFNEMLMRDFGLLVYQSVLKESLRKETKMNHKNNDSDDADKKKRLAALAQCHTNSNVPLSLAYGYFDLSHCHYITSKDVEDLFLTLGLQLSRAQVRKLLNKVVTDDCLRYKKLIDRPKDVDDDLPVSLDQESSVMDTANGRDMSSSVASSTGSSSSSLVMFNGSYINIDQLLLRLEQSEKSRRQIEQQFKSAQSQLVTCRMGLNQSTETITSLCRQLEVEKQHVGSTTEQLLRLQDCLGQYVDGMTKIRTISNNLLLSSSKNVLTVKDEAQRSDFQSELSELDKIDH